MSSNNTPLLFFKRIDSPWRRLPLTLPAALLIWALVLWGSVYFMERPSYKPVEPPPIDAQLIELPVPTPARHTLLKQPVIIQKPTKPLPLSRPKHATPPAPLEKSETEQRSAIKPKQAEVTSYANIKAPTAAVPSGANIMPHEGLVTTTAGTSAKNGIQAVSHYKNVKGAGMSASGGAQVIVRPKLQIPDDLRENAFNFVAMARFNIGSDGSAKVELIKPTPNPRLNQVLLENLRNW
ncbi:MAG: hypothetical protein M0022_02655, partial [Desulfobacteraceae bacterium]|nr:hypothetical protein [Desulfobacteraceae bacterium]